MLRARRLIRSRRRAFALSRLVKAVAAGVVLAMITVAARPAVGDASEAPDARTGPTARSKPARATGLPWMRGGTGVTGSDNWGASTACLALVLAVCGGLAVAARRLGPRAPNSPVQVVSRVSLSPKHSVYLLRVGRRVLVVGAGPQGPPALITELVDEPQEPPAPQREADS